MPTTTLCTAAEAVQQAADWLRQAGSCHLVLRARHNATGGLARLSLTVASQEEEVPSLAEADSETDGPAPAPADAAHLEQQRVCDPEQALRLVRELLDQAEGLRLLVRIWLDVSMELDTLSGVAVGQLLARRFLLTGLATDAARRTADGRCHVRIFAHITRLDSMADARLALSLRLVPEHPLSGAPPHASIVEVEFAAGKWDAYLLAALQLHTHASGPHRLELRTPEDQVLAQLPLTIYDTASSTGARRKADAADDGSLEPEMQSHAGREGLPPAQDAEQTEIPQDLTLP